MNRHDNVDKLLQHTAESLDIDVATYRLIEEIYGGVAEFLAQFWDLDDVEGVVYPQGSVPLGTVTKKIYRKDEVDIDSVVLRYLTTDQISKAQLKADVGDGLKQYLGTGPFGDPVLSEGKRCWTLTYEELNMHLDALPAVPNPLSLTGTGIKITDKSLFQWQYTDPKAFRRWFLEQMADEYAARREVLAKRMDIEQVPQPMIKTTLQQAVQLLKIHRDIYFEDNPDDKPASIILTTLAGLAYISGGSLYEVVEQLTKDMPTYIQRESGLYVLRNPVEENENFADRWNARPWRARAFFDWIEHAAADFSAIAHANGLHGAISKMGEVLGPRQAKYAAAKIGNDTWTSRRAGGMRYATGTGVVTTGAAATGRLVTPNHSFHGDVGARP
jgi:hypothetical protein